MLERLVAMMKNLITTFALLSGSVAFAGGTPQDHHCKQTDGTFDGTKTKKQCEAAKGTWAKDTELTGAFKTGITAIGGETTGIELATGGQTYELDLHGDAALLQTSTSLDGKQATVTGYATIKQGVEIKERHIFVVSTLKAAAPKK